MDQAMAESGIDPREEICIRRLVVPARLWLGLTDAALVSSWVSALAMEIRRAIDRRGDGIVRYHSRAEAIVDAVLGIAQRRRERRWAWRQMELPVDQPSTQAIVDVLIANPAVIVATFRALAMEPAFRDVVDRIDDDSVQRIVEAALAYAGAACSITAIAASPSTENTNSATVITSERPGVAQRHAARIARSRQKASSIASRTPLAPFLSRGQSRTRRVAMAALAVLEREPALLRASEEIVAPLLAMTAHALGQAIEASSPTSQPRMRESHSKRSASTPPATTPRSAKSDPAEAHARGPADTRDVDRVPASESREGNTDDSRAASIDEAASSPVTREDTAASSTSSEDSTSSSQTDEPLDLRTRAWTDWGGLLFLVNVARDVGLADRALDDPAVGGRPLAWVLERIAMTLVPANRDDAAVRAFAGLPPSREREIRTDDDQPAGGAEQAALFAMAGWLAESALARLDRAGDDAALYEICARRAEIVADPGWIEARFSLDQVSIEMRRAGLDLDPGYVEWLGVVMKFAYV